MIIVNFSLPNQSTEIMKKALKRILYIVLLGLMVFAVVYACSGRSWEVTGHAMNCRIML